MKKKYRLLAPGPVPVPRSALEELSKPVIHHRTPEFEAKLARVYKGLGHLFKTQNPVFIHSSTGSGGMQSALVNTLSPGDAVLCIVSGKFGERWAQMAESLGMKTTLYEVPWGEAAKPEVLDEYLKQNNFTAVLTQACETSTGTFHPIREMGERIQQEEHTLFLVDGITAIGCSELAMDDWHIDVLVGGSQKAFMIPTGLSFVSLSPRAWKAYEQARCPKFYFDLGFEKKARSSGQTYFSSSTSLILALEKTLSLLEGKKLQQQIQRCRELMKATHQAAQALGLSVYSQSPSPSVTALSLPEKIDGVKLREDIEEKHNVTLMGGQGPLKGKIIRLGHMGAISNKDMIEGFLSLAKELEKRGVNVGSGHEAKITSLFSPLAEVVH